MSYTRISDAADLVDEGWDAHASNAFVVYRVFDIWDIRITSELFGLDAGPEAMSIQPATGADGLVIEKSYPDLVITTELLRSIPMQDARNRLARHKLTRAAEEGYVEPIPERFETDRDFAILADIYARRVEGGERNPLKNMAQLYGISRNTLSARIRLARERGLLTRPTKDDPGSLTLAGKKLLNEKGGN